MQLRDVSYDMPIYKRPCGRARRREFMARIEVRTAERSLDPGFLTEPDRRLFINKRRHAEIDIHADHIK